VRLACADAAGAATNDVTVATTNARAANRPGIIRNMLSLLG
jgi:hypothetical protein